MSRKIIAFILVLPLLSACSLFSPPETPVTASSAPPVVTSSPQPDDGIYPPLGDVHITIEDFLSIESVDKVLVSSIIQGYVERAFSPYFLSGEWEGEPMSNFAHRFDGVFSKSLIEDIAALDSADGINYQTIMSLAPILSSSDVISSPEKCMGDTTLSNCMVGDIKVGNITVTPSNVSDSVSVVSFTVIAKRRVIYEGAMKTSDVELSSAIWVDRDLGHVVSIQNNYKYALVVAQ